jgi:hypothetical protein
MPVESRLKSSGDTVVVETAVEEVHGPDLLRPLLGSSISERISRSVAGVVIGTLVGIDTENRVPLVIFSGQSGSAAVRARSVVDLYDPHIGKDVVLAFEAADQGKPIIMGVLCQSAEVLLARAPEEIEIDSDGRRVVINANEQIVLRCGKASITLTKAGKVVITGTYVLTESSGANRIKGGSVDIN